ncbi:MAG: MBOAT family O-acyltransferase [Christensenellales bacterium]
MTGIAQLFGTACAELQAAVFLRLPRRFLAALAHQSGRVDARLRVLSLRADPPGFPHEQGAQEKAGTHIARALPAALGNILVFLLVGVWHGAQMNYVLWGLYNGVILAFTALVEPVYKKMNERLPRLTASSGFHLFRILRTFLVVNIGWYFDRCVRACDAFDMLHKTLFAFQPAQLFDGTLGSLGLAAKDYRILLIATFLLFIVSLMQERGVKVRDFVLSRPLALLGGALCVHFLRAGNLRRLERRLPAL